jgi:predicted nucleic acid-binding protein
MVRMGSPVRVRLRALSGAAWLWEERSRVAVDAIRHAVVAELPDQALILAAASIKSQHTIACADCFAVATAERHRDPVLTDDPELLELGRPELEVIDVRPAT